MEKLRAQLEKYGINDIEVKLDRYARYRAAILEANDSVNLTRITDPDEFEERHFVESLSPCASAEFAAAEKVVDVGTGAGFPGVPMAIAFPEKEFVLLDSLAKRMDIVAGICEEIGIENVMCVHARAEDAAREDDLREAFDFCVSRAVADLSVLSEYCLPFVKTGGYFVPFKGKGYKEELSAAGKAITALGGEVIRTEADALQNDDGVCIYILKKENTPDKYPRPAGKPSKKPIK